LPDGIRHGNVELRHLRYFAVVAEELNLRRAAHRLGITQPALTKQVTGLEEQMGVSLFARERYRLTGLTSAGAEFLAEARQIVEQVEDAIRRVQFVALGRSGRLRIGLTDDAATLARNSQRGRCIGALDLRKSCWKNGLSRSQGEPDADRV
jgi:DNA-binding transcriptional LysR family regulator